MLCNCCFVSMLMHLEFDSALFLAATAKQQIQDLQVEI